VKVDPLQRVRLKKLIEVAHRHLIAGESSAAEAIFQEMLLTNPEYSEALHGMGILSVAQSNYDVAEQWLRKALAADAAVAENWNTLGEVLRLLGRGDEAVEAYRQALSLAPEMPSVINNLAVGLAGQGNTEEAKSYFRQAIELDPADPHPYNNLGVVLEFEGQEDEALRCYERAVKCKHDFLEAKQNYTDLISRRPEKMMESMSRLLDDAKNLD
jgi:Flp pilus assembly protein TadD